MNNQIKSIKEEKPNITEAQAVDLIKEITSKIRAFTKNMPPEFALVYLKAESIACMNLIKELESARIKNNSNSNSELLRPVDD